MTTEKTSSACLCTLQNIGHLIFLFASAYTPVPLQDRSNVIMPFRLFSNSWQESALPLPFFFFLVTSITTCTVYFDYVISKVISLTYAKFYRYSCQFENDTYHILALIFIKFLFYQIDIFFQNILISVQISRCYI